MPRFQKDLHGLLDGSMGINGGYLRSGCHRIPGCLASEGEQLGYEPLFMFVYDIRIANLRKQEPKIIFGKRLGNCCLVLCFAR
ncbi:MAG: hypothetical protein MAGBODY4_00514 [Candidatus Marinimicrobia bacterium]|nr:hypothetical protein [Candidatus Neomarinimicrobiota bacterium]